MSKLSGRSAIITGGNQGLGLEIARAFVQEGSNVLLCARDMNKLNQVKQELSYLTSASEIVEVYAADVSSPVDVENLVQFAFSIFPKIDILVNNAGIYGPKGAIEDVSWDEWVKAIEINLFGSILMCRALMPHFKRNLYGKVIQLSGGGATNPMPFVSAYAASKAAVIRFAESLAGEVKDYKVDVNAIAPGPLNTRLLDEVLEAGPEKIGKAFYDRSLKQKIQGGAPLERGAALAVFLASAESDGITGKLISAIWDPWEEFDAHLQDVQESDIYTLRRIVPKDRNMFWGDK